MKVWSANPVSRSLISGVRRSAVSPGAQDPGRQLAPQAQLEPRTLSKMPDYIPSNICGHVNLNGCAVEQVSTVQYDYIPIRYRKNPIKKHQSQLYIRNLSMCLLCPIYIYLAYSYRNHTVHRRTKINQLRSYNPISDEPTTVHASRLSRVPVRSGSSIKTLIYLSN